MVGVSSILPNRFNPLAKIDRDVRKAFLSAGWKAGLLFTACGACFVLSGLLSPIVAATAVAIATLTIAIFAGIVKHVALVARREIMGPIKKWGIPLGSMALVAYIGLLAAILWKR